MFGSYQFASGYTDLPSRLATQASTLFSNNVTKYLLGALSKDGKYQLDLEDEVVRRSLVLLQGKLMWPAPLPPVKAGAPSSGSTPQPNVDSKSAAKEAEQKAVTPWSKQTREVAALTGVSSALLAAGKLGGSALAGSMSVLSFSGLIGYRSVFGVIPALHSVGRFKSHVESFWLNTLSASHERD